ncbi:hypothetical protein GIB67_039027 [Kingdonia uniflora]|uniref:Transmembrane protein n=1 Tax=Kingdonia uniflora TaxID=39325 RepID=A0A7J7LL42_9MAGN|nr:hypothetical protein GIB67_039027 [Kingdonia uniflora]
MLETTTNMMKAWNERDEQKKDEKETRFSVLRWLFGGGGGVVALGTPRWVGGDVFLISLWFGVVPVAIIGRFGCSEVVFDWVYRWRGAMRVAMVAGVRFNGGGIVWVVAMAAVLRLGCSVIWVACPRDAIVGASGCLLGLILLEHCIGISLGALCVLKAWSLCTIVVIGGYLECWIPCGIVVSPGQLVIGELIELTRKPSFPGIRLLGLCSLPSSKRRDTRAKAREELKLAREADIQRRRIAELTRIKAVEDAHMVKVMTTDPSRLLPAQGRWMKKKIKEYLKKLKEQCPSDDAVFSGED